MDNGELIRQEENYQSLCAKANIHWIRKSRRDPESGIEFNSTTSYGTLPYGLQVAPGCFPEVLNDGEDYPMTLQNIVFQSFKSENFLRFLTSVVWKRLRIMPYFNFSMEEQALNSSLIGQNAEGLTLQFAENQFDNDIRWHKYQPTCRRCLSHL